jgi:hypothetical protein
MKPKEYVSNWIEKANNQEELLAIFVKATRQMEDQAPQPAKSQEAFLDALNEIAVNKGRPTGGNSLGDTIMVQQHHKIIQYGSRTFCLSKRQIAVIIHENWAWVKPPTIQTK